MNNAAGLGKDLLVILNDNKMSICPRVGGLAYYLDRARMNPAYDALNRRVRKLLPTIPVVGDQADRWLQQMKDAIKASVHGGMLFEELGFTCLGPIDGHDMKALVDTLRTLKGLRGPQLLHVITTKGKGYERAEGDQIGYHAVSPFDPSKGVVAKTGASKPTYTDVFGDWLCDMAAADARLMGITPAMREGSGLVRFSREYPARYFDVAIAEQHAVTLAAGMACEGAKPVVAIYSTFLQRGYDQLVHDVAIQKLDVLFAIDRGGVVGPDGATHAGNLDLSYLRCVPNMVVMAPADERECRQMLSTGFRHEGPAAVRYPRGSGPGVAAGESLDTLPIGKAQVRARGARIALLAFGALVPAAETVAAELGLTVVNMRFIKPLDRDLLLELAQSHEGFVTLEDNVVMGGAGSGVLELLQAEGLTLPVLQLGLPDAFQHHASREDLLAEAGLDAAGIRAAILRRWPRLGEQRALLSASG